jgi:hypothetical protein
VPRPGDRCHLHKGKPLDGKRVLNLCYRTIHEVAALGGAYAAFEAAHPHIMSLWLPVRGLLMPEYFWHYGFEPKDLDRMRQEENAAHQKSKALEEKYSLYSSKEKRRVERVYCEILEYVESVRASA